MGRILGIDFGTKRIGCAVSDSDRRLATPLEVYHLRDPAQDARHFVRLVEDNEVDRIVVGLPVHLGGGEGMVARRAREFGAWLAQVTKRVVVFYDERFTTSDAEESLIEAGFKRSKRKDLRDMLAARILLQNYLDDGSPENPGQPLALDDREDR
ncbi:MAG: Holliday junction resolvase RuvX [Isosphaeraceae bacterium]